MALIFALIFAGLLFLVLIFNSDNLIIVSKSSFIFLIIVPLFLTIGIIISLLFYLKTPKAIDVYREQTALEITYKDKVPVDSTVVWKNK